MKKAVALMLSLCMCMSVTGCGNKTAVGGSGSSSNGGGSSADASKNYKYVEQTVDSSENPEKNEFVFVGEAGSITIKGYRSVKDFYNGYAIATNIDWDDTIIDTKGKEVLPAGKYEDIYLADAVSGGTYFIATDMETDGEGIIDAKGNVIISCEYEDVSTYIYYKEDSYDRAYYYLCEKEDGLTDVYNGEGKLLTSASDIQSTGAVTNGKNNSLIYVNTPDDTYYYSDVTGELVLKRSDYSDVLEWVYGRVVRYKAGEDYVSMIYSDDYSSCIVTDLEYISGVNECDGYILLDYSDYKIPSEVYDNKGNLLHTFDEDAYMSCDKYGNILFYTHTDDVYTVYNHKFEQIAQSESGGKIYFAYGYYYIPSADGETYTLYDASGNMLHENVKFMGEGQFFKVFQLSDGTIVYKGEETKELVTGGKEATFKDGQLQFTMMRFINEKDEYVLRNMEMKELVTFDQNADYRTYEDFDIFEVDGKFYNTNGKALYERKVK